MYIPNIAEAIKNMSVNQIKGIVFENYYKRIVFFKKKSYYSVKTSKKKD